MILMEINYLECGATRAPHIFLPRYHPGARNTILVSLLAFLAPPFLFSVWIASFSSLRDPSGRTNIAAPSDFNFTLKGKRRYQVCSRGTGFEDSSHTISPIRFHTSLSQFLRLYVSQLYWITWRATRKNCKICLSNFLISLGNCRVGNFNFTPFKRIRIVAVISFQSSLPFSSRIC